MSVYVCSDFHGFKSLYDQIHDFIQPEDKVFFLGDAADRGPYGWECIKAILDDPQWTYIIGNHDYCFISAVLGPYMVDHSAEHYQNGGKYTMEAFLDDDPETRIDYLKRLRDCPYDLLYINQNGDRCYMSHSGAYYNHQTALGKEDFVWDRSHILAPVPEEVDYIFHGHTTIPHLIEKLDRYSKFEDIDMNLPTDIEPGRAFWYSDGHKCDVDNCTIATGSCVLVDLDTFEEHSFFISNDEEEFLW